MTLCVLDTDGVLADLMRGLAAVHRPGQTLAEVWRGYEGNYSLSEVLGMSGNKVWQHPDVDHGGFWSSLPKTPWADDLVAFCRARFDQVVLVTKPVLNPDCLAGKARWYKEHYPDLPYFIGTADRSLLAPGVLVDDSDENVNRWVEKGPAILLPALWNSLHARAADPLGEVVRVLEECEWIYR